MALCFVRKSSELKYSLGQGLSLPRLLRFCNGRYIFEDCSLSLTASNLYQIRSYAFKSDLKIKWVRPEKISCIKPEKSGDLGKLTVPSLKEFPIEFQNSSELANASDLVKKVFSLEFKPRYKRMNIARVNMVDIVKRHNSDSGSHESKIASMTGQILNYQQIMEEFPKDKQLKVVLKELIDKRKKYLKYLRRWDYKRFEWLLEKLHLIYKSPPSEFKWITRKDSLHKLTDKYCEDLRNERLQSYKESLDSQKLGFLQRKVETLQWIQEEEKACGVASTVGQEEIDEVLEQIKQMNTNNEDAKSA